MADPVRKAARALLEAVDAASTLRCDEPECAGLCMREAADALRAALSRPVPAADAEAVREALLANERDRTLVARALTAFDEAVNARSWLTQGRGPYEWDDDRFYAEFSAAVAEFRAAIQPLRVVGLDMSNCPRAVAAVAEARAQADAAIRALPLPAPDEVERARWEGMEAAIGVLYTNTPVGFAKCIDLIRDALAAERAAAKGGA